MDQRAIFTFIIFYVFIGYCFSDNNQDTFIEELKWIEVIPCNDSNGCLLHNHVKAMGLSMEGFLATHMVAYGIVTEKADCNKRIKEFVTNDISESLQRFNITIGRLNCSAKSGGACKNRFEDDEIRVVFLDSDSDNEGNDVMYSACELLTGHPFQELYQLAVDSLIVKIQQIEPYEKANSDQTKPLVIIQKKAAALVPAYVYILISDLQDIMHVSWGESESIRTEKMLTIDMYQPSDCKKPIIESIQSLMSCRTAHFKISTSDTLENILCKVYTASLGGMKSQSNRSIDLRSELDNSWYPFVRKLFQHCDVVIVYGYKKTVSDAMDVTDLRLEETNRFDSIITLTLTEEQVVFVNEKLRMKEIGNFYLHARQMGYFAYTGDDYLPNKIAFIELKIMLANAEPKTYLKQKAFNGDTNELFKLLKNSNRFAKESPSLRTVNEKGYEVFKKRPLILYLYTMLWSVPSSSCMSLLKDALVHCKGKKGKLPKVFIVDCYRRSRQCQGDGITTYPQVVLYRSGETIPYKGSFTKQAFINLILVSSYPRIIKIKSEGEWREMTEFFSEDLHNYIIGVNLEKNEEAWKAFESVSQEMQTDQVFVSLNTEYYVQERILARLQEKNETLNDSYLIALSYIEYPELIHHEGPLTMESVKKFALTAQYDRLIQLTWSRFVELSKLSRPLLLIFFKNATSRDVKVLNGINLIFRSQITTALPDMDVVQFSRVFKAYGLTQMPGYALYRSIEKTVHVYSGNVSRIDELKDWLQDALTEKIVPNITLTKMPFTPQHTPYDFTHLVYPTKMSESTGIPDITEAESMPIKRSNDEL